MDRKIERKKGLKRKHIYYAIGIMLFVLLIYKAFFTENISTYAVDADKLSIATVQDGVFKDYIRVTGSVEPIATIYLDAMEGGRVEERIIEEGAMVKKGDIILRLSNPDLNLSILNSEAQLAEKSNFLRNTMVVLEQEKLQVQKELLRLEYDIKRKKRAFEQNSALIKEKLISDDEYIKSKEDYEFAKSSYDLNLQKQRQDSIYRKIQVTQMQDNLRNMKLNLELVRQREENLNVKAPIDGQLGMLDAQVGQRIGRGVRIGQINVLTNYKVQAMIDEHYIDRVRVGLSASFERQDKIYNMTLKKVYPEVRQGQFRVDLVLKGEKPDNIRTGQSYHISLELGQPEQAILLSRGGFFQSTGGQWVYVLDESGEFATKRSIRIGKQNPRYYEVIEGLKAGEQVITSGYDNFGDNDKLIIK